MIKTHLSKILASAERRLALTGKESDGEKLRLYQKFLKIEEHRIRLRHNAGAGGRENVSMRVDLMDILLRHIFSNAVKSVGLSKTPDDGERVSLVAIGGYGRGELNPFSDVDIMFLHGGSGTAIEKATSTAIEKVLYMLWDIGFKVGHSTRSIKSAIQQANEDLLSKTSMLESRLLAGSASLFAEFQETFIHKCVQGKEDEYILWRLKSQHERHQKAGATVFVQEPNVKSGVGGLRDYQSLLWLTYFKQGILSTAKLVEEGLLPGRERKQLENAYDFLLRVRSELHYQHKRANDSMTLFTQGQIANAFDYPQRNILRRSEEFMRDYYQHARNIYIITKNVSQRMSLPVVNEEKAPRIFNFLARRKPTREDFDGFYSENGLIHVVAKDVFDKDPQRLMRIFLHAQNRQMTLSPQVSQLIRRRLRLIDRTYQYSRAARQTFSTILSKKGQVGRVLRMMHEVDFLGAYMPEFGQLTCLVQHEFYHRYTADEHTLRVIEQLDMLIDTDEKKLSGYRSLFEKLEDPYVLYLAALLHDSGRASNASNHSDASTLFAQKVARRLQLRPEQRRHLIFLVDNHTLLSHTAQRRNLDDSATITEFAGIVGSQRNLDALMVLTLADGQGTTDGTEWSDWKESLVWQLCDSTHAYLEDSKAFYEQQKVERMSLEAEVVKKLGVSYVDEVNAHFESMPEFYFRSCSVAEIAWHLKLFRQFFTQLQKPEPVNSLQPLLHWIDHPSGSHSEVQICTWDRAGLLERIAGAFAAAELNILGADIYSREDNLVLDIFRVCTTTLQAVTHANDRALFEKILVQSLVKPEFSMSATLKKVRRGTGYHLSQEVEFPTRLTITNDAHPKFTLVDIQTPDRLGLLYEVLQGFHEAGVQIALSRVATEKGGAIDSFYITDAMGAKIKSRETLDHLQRILLQSASPQAIKG